jgi:hypothetical protein
MDIIFQDQQKYLELKAKMDDSKNTPKSRVEIVDKATYDFFMLIPNDFVSWLKLLETTDKEKLSLHFGIDTIDIVLMNFSLMVCEPSRLLFSIAENKHDFNFYLKDGYYLSLDEIIKKRHYEFFSSYRNLLDYLFLYDEHNKIEKAIGFIRTYWNNEVNLATNFVSNYEHSKYPAISESKFLIDLGKYIEYAKKKVLEFQVPILDNDGTEQKIEINDTEQSFNEKHLCCLIWLLAKYEDKYKIEDINSSDKDDTALKAISLAILEFCPRYKTNSVKTKFSKIRQNMAHLAYNKMPKFKNFFKIVKLRLSDTEYPKAAAALNEIIKSIETS